MGTSTKPIVVISGVNFIEGGPLSVMMDVVGRFISTFNKDFTLLLIVNNKHLFSDFFASDVLFYEYPRAKKSWLFRLWFEYVKCYFLSKKIKPYLWLSLHDISPNIKSTRRAVYCHNSIAFYKMPFLGS